MPRSDFIVALIFALCTVCLAAAYPRIDLNSSYQEILEVRNIPFLMYYIPSAIAFWLLQLIAVCFLGKQSHGQSTRAYWLKIGLSVLMLGITGLFIAWKMRYF